MLLTFKHLDAQPWCFEHSRHLTLSCSCQIMYAIRTRNGNVYMKIKRNFGDMSALNVSFAVQRE